MKHYAQILRCLIALIVASSTPNSLAISLPFSPSQSRNRMSSTFDLERMAPGCASPDCFCARSFLAISAIFSRCVPRNRCALKLTQPGLSHLWRTCSPFGMPPGWERTQASRCAFQYSPLCPPIQKWPYPPVSFDATHSQQPEGFLSTFFQKRVRSTSVIGIDGSPKDCLDFGSLIIAAFLPHSFSGVNRGAAFFLST